MVYYLWLALLFIEAIEIMEEEVEELSAFMWGDRTSPEEEDDEMPEGSCQEEEIEGMPAGSGEGIGGMPKEPYERMEFPKRKRKTWTSERMRKIIQRESMQWMGVRLNISAWRQVVIVIARKLQMDIYEIEDESKEGFEDFDEDNTKGDSPWDLQSGHGTRITGMIYARLISEGLFENRSEKERFRQVSQEWHRFLGFSSIRNHWRQMGKRRRQYHWEEMNRNIQ